MYRVMLEIECTHDDLDRSSVARAVQQAILSSPALVSSIGMTGATIRFARGRKRSKGARRGHRDS